MENKIISIDITPDSQGEINENAGVMWEHNATTLKFNIAPDYIGDYRYYIEYRSLMGTKVRTQYLALDTEANTITYNIPMTMTCLKGVECYFNIISIDEDGNTVQVVKPRKFCLSFDYSPDTDNSIARENDFSINALLEAIRLGTFKGEKGDSITIDTKMSKYSENAVQNKVIVEYIQKIADEVQVIMDDAFKNFEQSVVSYITRNTVQKEDGKGLSTNDFTDEDKTKLENSVSKEYVDAEIAKILARLG
ncbi:MAG: hypothetical protein IJA80_00135 [Clostridia bacterium]|nr:hypothetical protein [Clostridia bacterium]